MSTYVCIHIYSRIIQNVHTKGEHISSSWVQGLNSLFHEQGKVFELNINTHYINISIYCIKQKFEGRKFNEFDKCCLHSKIFYMSKENLNQFDKLLCMLHSSSFPCQAFVLYSMHVIYYVQMWGRYLSNIVLKRKVF